MSFSGDSCGGNLKTTAALNASFKQPGDKVEYTLTIGNKGTLAAAIESINVDGSSVTSDTTITKGNIKYIIEMPLSTSLAVNATTTMKVTAMFQNDTEVTNSTNEQQTISVSINAVQDDGNGGFTPTPTTFTGTIYRNNTNVLLNGLTYNGEATVWYPNSYSSAAEAHANYYAGIVKSIRVADSYDTIGMVYQINFDREKKYSNKLISEFKMMEVDTGLVEEEYFKKYRISLVKAKELSYTIVSKLTKFERLLLMIQSDSKKELRRLAKGDEELMAMEKKIEDLSEDPKYASLYDEEKLAKAARSLWLHEETEKALIDEKKETAKKMLDDKLNIDVIAKYTGLSKEEILSLKD